MQAYKRVVAVVLSVSLVACASTSNYSPVIDSQGVDSARYQQDLFQCQQFSRQVASCQDRAAAAGFLGAVIGLGFAALAHDHKYNGVYAGVGALSAAGGACESGIRDQKTIISRCLEGRGYRVLQP